MDYWGGGASTYLCAKHVANLGGGARGKLSRKILSFQFGGIWDFFLHKHNSPFIVSL